MTVRVRLAPSPTGFIHIGNLRTALYNFFLARKEKGTVILRFEDTDQTRYVPGAIEAFCRSLQALNLIPDEGIWIDDAGKLIEHGSYSPYLQSKRKDKHRAYADQLLEKGLAYPCFCTEARLEEMRQAQHSAGLPTRYDRHCRAISKEDGAELMKKHPYVLRLALPETGEISFTDSIRGKISFQWKEMDDQVIIKSDGMATYHLAATCDDHDMEITHVIRGEEWLSSTPKHLFIYQSFGWTPPQYAHVPLLLNADRSKLSKRQNDVSTESYLEKGYLPQALMNFLALLGWNPSGTQEIYTFDELAKAFDLSKVNKSGAVANFEKLDWLNTHYLNLLSDEEFLAYAEPPLLPIVTDIEMRHRLIACLKGRISKKADILTVAQDFLETDEIIDPTIIPWKKQEPKDVVERLRATVELFHLMKPEDWASSAALEAKVKQMIQDHEWGNGDTLWPLRVALSGKQKSPPPFDLLFVLGEEESVRRIKRAIASLGH
ncbi:MAG: glutamate--tRNA ligase [Patescibacteria group bacterium]